MHARAGPPAVSARPPRRRPSGRRGAYLELALAVVDHLGGLPLVGVQGLVVDGLLLDLGDVAELGAVVGRQLRLRPVVELLDEDGRLGALVQAGHRGVQRVALLLDEGLPSRRRASRAAGRRPPQSGAAASVRLDPGRWQRVRSQCPRPCSSRPWWPSCRSRQRAAAPCPAQRRRCCPASPCAAAPRRPR